MNGNTKIIDIDLAGDIKKSITINDDISIDSDDAKKVVYSAKDDDLVRVVKLIGSPIKIIKADIITDDFMKNNLIKKE